MQLSCIVTVSIAKLCSPMALNMWPTKPKHILDEIALVQSGDKRVTGESFQVWQLTVNGDKTATVTCEDGTFCM